MYIIVATLKLHSCLVLGICRIQYTLKHTSKEGLQLLKQLINSGALFHKQIVLVVGVPSATKWRICLQLQTRELSLARITCAC